MAYNLEITLIVGLSGWIIKEGASILHQIFRFSGGIYWSRIHHSKSWYSLGLSQTSKLYFFAEIVLGCKPLTFFLKRLQLRCLTGSIRRFQKLILCFVRDDFASWKKHLISTPVCLTLLFKKKKCYWLKGGWVSRKGAVIKRAKWNI